jgi:serine/threonine protein kinase
MCIVYSAEHLFTGRTVAVKVPRSDQVTQEAARQRLLREARALEFSRHPHVVEVLDAGLYGDGVPYLIMEMIEGRTLEGILAARRQLPIVDTVSIIRQVCEGVACAHAYGVTHRDLKPSNIMLFRTRTGEESVKVIDFSIAALTADRLQPHDPKITRREELLGTPEYMAPEQLLLLPDTGPRSDIYSIAVTLFECLTGVVPHPGAYGQVIMGVTTKPVPSVRDVRPDVGQELSSVISHALARSPQDRIQDLNAFSRALLAVCPTASRPSALLPGARPGTGRQPAVAGFPVEPLTSSARAVVPPEVVQRRKFERQPYVAPIRMVQADRMFDGRTEDISEGGLLFVIPKACASGGNVTVRFAAPLSGRVQEVVGEVRWVRDAHGKAAVGVEFSAVPDELRREIAQYVTLMGQAPRSH